MTQHILYLSSDRGTLPGSTNGDFTVSLPKRLTLPGEWVCALLEFHCPSITGVHCLHVCTNICEESIVGDCTLPILKKIMYNDFDFGMNDLIYLRVNQRELTHIRIYIKDDEGRSVSFQEGTLTCTLRLQRVVS